MNGSTENTKSGAFEKPSRRHAVLTLDTANRMLTLVRRIVDDLVQTQQHLNRLQPEQDRLDRQRRTLDWPERFRRYQLREEIAAEERHFQEASAELDVLGVMVFDVAKGRVGFPTIVNDRRAYFSWEPG